MTTAAPRLERDAVLAALTARDVLARFGVAGTTRGAEFRTRLCPSCGPRSRDAVVINLDSGRWVDQAHGCHGDLLALVAQLGGLDCKRDFQRVLELAADVAGVGPDVDPAVVAAARARQAEQEAAAAAARKFERVDAIRYAGNLWRRAGARHPHGERYLAGRGLDPQELIARGAVRFDYGDPIVALYSSRGQVINVVRRKVDPGAGPKVLGLASCPTLGTLVGHLDQVRAGATVVLTEGVADSLAAVLVWPGAVVLGAHGASNMEAIGQYAAKLAALAGGCALVIVPHLDPPSKAAPLGVGLEAATKASCWALQAQVPTTMIDLAPHKDLAEAWSKGWRP